ncbi:hypothetical protein ACHAWU_004067 [Discostella pseudostelligera]|uniref:Uncharacterized protein n=1 Tax=Discostella pseudostelligera TaxID=259834 RepID=A0ABD3MJI3_9STRA
MSAATTPPLHVLRGILRLIKSSSSVKTSTHDVSLSSSASTSATATGLSTQSPPSSSSSSSSSSLYAHVLSQYRQSKFLLPPQSTQQRQIAYDYYILKQDLVERARLHKLDMGADEKLSPRELARRSAARAGLQLPEEVG